MRNRKLMLVPSFLAAVAVYGSLYLIAPSIHLIQANSTAKELLDLFQVDLWETPEPPSLRERSVDSTGGEPRPERIEDLLERNSEPLTDPEPLLEAAADVPLLADRVASDEVQRVHDLDQDDLAFVASRRLGRDRRASGILRHHRHVHEGEPHLAGILGQQPLEDGLQASAVGAAKIGELDDLHRSVGRSTGRSIGRIEGDARSIRCGQGADAGRGQDGQGPQAARNGEPQRSRCPARKASVR